MPVRIVLTGPESSGKTTLAKDLAQVLDTSLVPEFSRAYLAGIHRPYQYHDLNVILSGQQAWERWYVKNTTKPFLICDTDWTVIRVWELYGYGSIELTKHERVSANTHYFLCAPDIPWQPDALREHPNERDVLFAHYEALLTGQQANFTILHGDVATRLKIAQAIIRKLC